MSYDVDVATLAHSVLRYIKKHNLLKPGDRVGVAVSGGADSVALLRLLLELRKEIGVVLSVVHFNHQLRGADSEADERFVAELAQYHQLASHRESADIAADAAEKHLSVEAAARKLRYEFFRRLLVEDRLDRVATAHTCDDQAETVLMRIVRGAGSRGLAGIYPRLGVKNSTQQSAASIQPSSEPNLPSIVRPLLATQRRDLEAYLKQINQTWREDKSNQSLLYKRNRVRHRIMPRLERYLNPAVRSALAEAAEIARAEEDYWADEVKRVTPLLARQTERAVLELDLLGKLPLALQRRVIRYTAETIGLMLDFRHTEQVIEVISGEKKSAVLPDGWMISRTNDKLLFEAHADSHLPQDYEYPLPVPGSVRVFETRSCYKVTLIACTAPDYNPEYLLDRSQLAQELRVRNWRPGDRFWPAHTRAPKKIKQLLQQRRATGLERKLWPVVTSGPDLVWMRGFGVSMQLRPKDGTDKAVLIQELPLSESQTPPTVDEHWA